MLRNILRAVYHFVKRFPKRLKTTCIYLRDMLRYPFEKRITYNVYGASANKAYYLNYPLLAYFPCEKESFVLSTFRPKIQFFESSSDNLKLIRRKTDQMKVFMTGECVHSAVVKTAKLYEDNCVNDVDISLGFDYLPNENYVRYPFWFLRYFSPSKDKSVIDAKVAEINARVFEKTKFCSLIASHDKTGIREKLLPLVNSVCDEKVDCAGRFAHNDDSLTEVFADSKDKYLQQYKFNLCPENDAYKGYVTEKIFDALWSGCIPIYNGGEMNPEPEVINEKAYIYLDPENPAAALEKIKELAADEKSYARFVAEPKLKDTAGTFVYETMQKVYRLFEEKYKKYFGNPEESK